MDNDYEYTLDKLQVASVRLADTIYGFFAGNHPVTTVDNARAVCAVINNLYKFLKRRDLIQDIVPESFDHLDDYFAAQQQGDMAMLSNFAKHADTDPDCVATYCEFGATSALQEAVDTYMNFVTVGAVSRIINFNMAFWHQTPFCQGPAPIVMCEIFKKWGTEEVVDLSQIYAKSLGFTSVEDWNTWDPDDQQTLDVYFAEVVNTERKLRWKRVIDDLNLWPVPSHGGLTIARDKSIDFKHRKSKEIVSPVPATKP